MKKQEAIDFIMRELQNNRSQEEITLALSQKLNAPTNVVSKFVAEVVSQQAPAPISRRIQPGVPPPVTSGPQSYDPIVQQFVVESPVAISTETQAPVGQRVTTSGPADPESTYTREEPYAISDDKPGRPPAPGAVTASMYEDDPELEKLIVSLFAKGRKHSDVVMAICERTGMNWDQAQRLVSRVSAQNRKKLATQQNMILIPISVVAVLGGMALIFATVNEAYNLTNAVRGVESDPTVLYDVEYIVREVFWAVAVGSALILGGAVGLFRALQSQFEHN